MKILTIKWPMAKDQHYGLNPTMKAPGIGTGASQLRSWWYLQGPDIWEKTIRRNGIILREVWFTLGINSWYWTFNPLPMRFLIVYSKCYTPQAHKEARHLALVVLWRLHSSTRIDYIPVMCRLQKNYVWFSSRLEYHSTIGLSSSILTSCHSFFNGDWVMAIYWSIDWSEVW